MTRANQNRPPLALHGALTAPVAPLVAMCTPAEEEAPETKTRPSLYEMGGFGTAGPRNHVVSGVQMYNLVGLLGLEPRTLGL